MNPEITIFTPTFNRAHLLPKLYESIKSQKFTDFEWLVVDDGSTDETEELIFKYRKQCIINISYFRKENRGKHSAVNFGVQKANGSLFVLIDSDDLFAEDALEVLHEKFSLIKNNIKIGGLAALSADPNGKLIGTEFLKDDWQVSFTDIYLRYNIKGDKMVAFKTDVLKAFPFPEPQGITFVFEAVVWHEIAKKYNVLALNQVLQIVDYQSAGVSDSSYKKWYVKSLAFSFYTLINNKTHPFSKYPKTFMWNYINLGINSKLAGEDYYQKLKQRDKFIYLICLPRAVYSYRNMKKKCIDHD